MKKSLYIITGCSKGLGRALTDTLTSDQNNQVVGISRSGMYTKENFLHITLDLSDIHELERNFERIFLQGDFQRLVLINNAGWIGDIAPLGKLGPEGIESIFHINLIAPALLMNRFVREYKGSKAEKTVINISSGAARKAIDGWSCYCSTKAGLNQLTAVAEEESQLNNLGIKYYALSPGIFDTEMQHTIRSSSLDNFSRGDKFRSYKKNGDLSSPEEVAGKVLQLIEKSKNFKEVLLDVRTL